MGPAECSLYIADCDCYGYCSYDPDIVVEAHEVVVRGAVQHENEEWHYEGQHHGGDPLNAQHLCLLVNTAVHDDLQLVLIDENRIDY